MHRPQRESCWTSVLAPLSHPSQHQTHPHHQLQCKHYREQFHHPQPSTYSIEEEEDNRKIQPKSFIVELAKGIGFTLCIVWDKWDGEKKRNSLGKGSNLGRNTSSIYKKRELTWLQWRNHKITVIYASTDSKRAQKQIDLQDSKHYLWKMVVFSQALLFLDSWIERILYSLQQVSSWSYSENCWPEGWKGKALS